MSTQNRAGAEVQGVSETGAVNPQTALEVARPKAYFIDDAWAAPQSNVLSSFVPSLRQLLIDHEDVRTWFINEYGATGNHRTTAFYDNWVAGAANDIRFWNRVSSSPRFEELRESWGEIGNTWHANVLILERVRVGLEAAGFDVAMFSKLPDFNPEDMPSIIVLDYILAKDADSQKIAESTHWLSGISDHCLQTADAKPPFVLLVSSALSHSETETKAKAFRQDSKTMSSHFRMVPKAVEEFDSRVVGLANHHHTIAATTLLQFYAVYKELRKGFQNAASAIASSIDRLELEDLVTFHAAQLRDEGTLNDYLAWLYGQVLTSKLLRQAGFVKAGRGVVDSDEVLLGQLKPQQLLPELFHEASFLATLEQIAPEAGPEKIQFANMYHVVGGSKTVLLVVSQTCDLIQCKITNGQVLCVEGTLTELDVNAEVALLKMTIDQIAKEHQVYRVDEKFYSVDWGNFKNLRTVTMGDLDDRSKWKLIGRLNELYALNIQASAMQAVGRIGLPVVPHYVHYISKISISIVKNQQRVQTKDIGRGDVIGVIRPHNKNCAIQLTAHIREEMAKIIDELVDLPKLFTGVPNKKALSALLRDASMRGFTGKGDMDSGIDFKHVLMYSKNGEGKSTDRPKFSKIYGRITLPQVEDGSEHLEVLFQPISATGPVKDKR